MEKKQLTRKLTSVADKEAALEALEQKRLLAQSTNTQISTPSLVIEKKTREVHRFNIELPMDLYTDIRGHIDVTGQTLKGFLCLCAREYLQNKTK